jgi:hypothetical protein
MNGTWAWPLAPRRRTLGTVALLAALLIGSAAPLRAQDTVDSARRFVDQTREILQATSDLLPAEQRAGGEAARVLARAWDLQRGSEQLLADARPALAVAMSTRAREAGLEAARLARRSLNAEQRTRQRYDRVREYCDTLAERAREADNAIALRFVQEASRRLRLAEAEYDLKHFDTAGDLVESAESLLNRAARLLFEQGGATRLEQDLERTAAIVERSREQAQAAHDRRALEAVARAQAALDEAKAALARRQPVRALRMAGQARRLAGLAASLLEGTPEPSAVSEQIARWDARRGEIEGRARRADDRRALGLIDQAAGQRNAAANLLEARQVEEALRHIKIAHDLLSQAAERVR